jgi:hypothetical protein
MPEAVRQWRETRHATTVEGGQACNASGGRPEAFATVATTTEARSGASVEGGQTHDGGHAHAGGGGRLGFATAVTTMEARGDAAVEAKHTTMVEQRPPSLTSKHNRWRRRSSLNGGPLLRQPNDGGHGSGCGDGLLPAQRRRWWEYR